MVVLTGQTGEMGLAGTHAWEMTIFAGAKNLLESGQIPCFGTP
jgi:hypothetical protein